MTAGMYHVFDVIVRLIGSKHHHFKYTWDATCGKGELGDHVWKTKIFHFVNLLKCETDYIITFLTSR